MQQRARLWKHLKTKTFSWKASLYVENKLRLKQNSYDTPSYWELLPVVNSEIVAYESEP